ncbi:MAG: hypothetical protein DWQ07_11125 [Chloroflexi bacterium]|nr:MAG: hypothetical protein DWQ07_11125 [Chloroflexota bacterium]MBL1192733.1 hypothetical protein [Chloroflexota bacterium]NOH10025.1 hypothetical protein [Chloroflexota bacterium]
MNAAYQKLTLDQAVTYEIKVPGALDEHWLGGNGGMKLSIEYTEKDTPITTITICVDQAALHSLLQRIYSLGLPVISVVCVEFGT